MTVASIYLSAPVIAKFGNVKEQFMIALMVMGICCFVWYRLTGGWWWALLSGALLIGGPMFKQTGVSAIAAVGLFILVQPLLHHEAWKKVGKDILLLVGRGDDHHDADLRLVREHEDAAVLLAVLVRSWAGVQARGRRSEIRRRHRAGSAGAGRSKPRRSTKTDDSLILRLLPGYVSDSWRMLGPAERKESLRRVLRYYSVLILPIALAFGAIWRAPWFCCGGDGPAIEDAGG